MRTVRKAALAAGFAAAAWLGGCMKDGNVTTAELIASAGFGLIAGAATWRVPNAD